MLSAKVLNYEVAPQSRLEFLQTVKKTFKETSKKSSEVDKKSEQKYLI